MKNVIPLLFWELKNNAVLVCVKNTTPYIMLICKVLPRVTKKGIGNVFYTFS